MTKVEQLERDIMALSRSDLAALRDWFQSYLADEWDRRIEADLEAGKLDHLAREALADHKAGRTKPLLTASRRLSSGNVTAACPDEVLTPGPKSLT